MAADKNLFRDSFMAKRAWRYPACIWIANMRGYDPVPLAIFLAPPYAYVLRSKIFRSIFHKWGRSLLQISRAFHEVAAPVFQPERASIQVRELQLES